MVNKVILVGRLGKDPEIRDANGQSVANLSLATDETYKDRSGERQKKTEWHRLVAWGKTAEVVQKFLHKGDLIYVEGKIQTREFEDRSGTKKSTTEILVANIKFIQTDRAKQTESSRPQEVPDEDIPF